MDRRKQIQEVKIFVSRSSWGRKGRREGRHLRHEPEREEAFGLCTGSVDGATLPPFLAGAKSVPSLPCPRTGVQSPTVCSGVIHGPRTIVYRNEWVEGGSYLAVLSTPRLVLCNGRFCVLFSLNNTAPFPM